MNAWMRRAACRGEDLALFFGPDNETRQAKEKRETAAKAVCAGCPVRWQCLSYAIARPEQRGVWGGMGEDERALERRRYLRRLKGRAA